MRVFVEECFSEKGGVVFRCVVWVGELMWMEWIGRKVRGKRNCE